MQIIHELFANVLLNLIELVNHWLIIGINLTNDLTKTVGYKFRLFKINIQQISYPNYKLFCLVGNKLDLPSRFRLHTLQLLLAQG